MNEPTPTPQGTQKPSEQMIPGSSYSPFEGAVNDKTYSKPTVAVSQQDLTLPIPEPTFEVPPVVASQFDDPMEHLMKEQKAKQQGQQKPPPPPPPFNPAVAGLSEDEQQEGAEKMAEALMTGYKFLNEQANGLIQISERKVLKMMEKGEININGTVPYDYDKRMPVGEFIDTYNKQAEHTFYVSKSFEDKVMPVLTRVLKKRGAGLSDEQLLGTYVAKDVIQKVIMGRQMRSTLNQILHMCKEESRQPSAPPPPPVPPPVQPPPHPAPPPVPTEHITPGSPLDTQTRYLDKNMPVPASQTMHEPPPPIWEPPVKPAETIVAIPGESAELQKENLEQQFDQQLAAVAKVTPPVKRSRGRQKGWRKKK